VAVKDSLPPLRGGFNFGSSFMHMRLTMESSPEELAQQACEGCADSSAALVELFHSRIYSYLARLTGNSADAADLTQETFVKAFASLRRFDPQRRFSTWLFTIAKRTSCNHLRSRRPYVELDDTVADPGPSPDHAAAEREDSIWQLARRLKPLEYEALWLHYGEDLPVEDTARVLGISTLYTRVILHRSRRKLGKLIQSHPNLDLYPL
jgi:RNA polymerase sigma-70 factor, ECF subfamily